MMTTLAAFWDISIYGLSLMPYIEIMLTVVRAFGKVTCVWPLLLICIKYGMNPEFVQRIETMVWVVAKCGFRTWPCFALLPTMTLRRNDTFWVAISNSICVLLMMTTLAAFWDISIYGISLMPYIEIMLNVVRAFGKVTCVWPLFLICIKYGMNPEFVRRIETMVRVVAKCGFRTWPCFALLPTMTLRGNDTFWVAISNSTVSYWWWHSLRHRNSCLHENATLKNDLNRFFFYLKMCHF